MSNDYRDMTRTAKQWLLDHMAQEIDCVAVTDHNSGHWIDELKSELELMRIEGEEGFRELVIFPGVEITVNGNIHVLAIFDPSDGSEKISRVLGRCEYEGQIGASDSCTRKSFNEVIDIICNLQGIAIPAHVDQPCGLFVEQRGNSLSTCLTAKGIFAMQVCNPEYEKPQLYIQSKLNYTEVCGSDSHRPSQVGSSFSWVKMEQPNLTALRLALHDGDDGVIRGDCFTGSPNDLGNRFYINNISIVNGAKVGRPQALEVSFSPWLNSIIGGRGSGKSSLIEFMRLPLDNTRGMPKKIEDEFLNFKKVPSDRGRPGMLLSNTKIRVELRKDARDIALTWENNTITEEHKDPQSHEWLAKEETSDIDIRFPIRIFSQKQLHALTEDPNSIINIIDDQFDKKGWNEKNKELIRKWLELRSSLRAINSETTSKVGIVSEIDDIKAKMKVFEESGYKEILENFQKSQLLQNRILEKFSTIDAFATTLSTNVIAHPDITFSEGELIQLDTETKVIIEAQLQRYRGLIEQLVGLSLELKSFSDSAQVAVEALPWQKTRNEHQIIYEQFVEELRKAGERNPNAYGDLVGRKRVLEQKIIDIEKLEVQLGALKQESNSIYALINEHQKELRNLRMQVINRWQGDNRHIRMYLEIMGNLDDAENNFRGIIRKTSNEYSRDILERDEDGNPSGGFIYELSKSDDRWEFRQEIIKRIVAASESDTKGLSRFLVRHLATINTSTPEDTDRLILWYPDDKITLKIVSPSGREEDIETGSAGQRTAAMLSLMLLLDESPLIIDQPEEDLDTKRITDLVVKGLRDFKSKQQIIVITHNPNIPVNGAAENIIHMAFSGGQIRKQSSGALQDKDIRESVCEVMEGGKDALDKRYFRISKALG